ncbi:MAG: hypothetical protein HY321_15810 [Armatimonadetes bacterium]|nr:hypothetical protein [Armatimonadota bacterium]
MQPTDGRYSPSAGEATTRAPNGLIEWACGEIGPERVIFGTDAPMRDPRPQLGWVVFTRFPAAEKERIPGSNFRRILMAGRLPGFRLPERFVRKPAQ